MDYAKLVKALRCNQGNGLCPYADCEYKSKNAPTCMPTRLTNDAADAIEALQAELEKKRTADCWGCKCEKIEPKQGEWIHGRELGKEWVYDHWVTYFEDWRCSNCGVVIEQESKPKYHYCPNCGVKMTEVQDESV